MYSTLVRAKECEVERLGMDENWVDVSRMVEIRMSEGYQKIVENNVICLECEERLLVGSMIAIELVRSEHGLTCSAGVSYNMLLAKVCGGGWWDGGAVGEAGKGEKPPWGGQEAV